MLLSENKKHMRQQLSPNTPKIGLRLEYIGNVFHLSPRTFSPKDLVLVFERKMNPQQPTSAIRHININSQFSVGEKGPYPVYIYAEPTELLPQFYYYLLNGNGPQKKLWIIFDKKTVVCCFTTKTVRYGSALRSTNMPARPNCTCT